MPFKNSSICDDRTLIAVSTLLRVLEGVAVATKASDQDVELLSRILQSGGAHESFTNIHPNEGRIIFEAAFPINTWKTIISSNPDNHAKEGSSSIEPLADLTLAISLLREQSRRNLTIPPSTLDSIWHLIHSTILSNSSPSSPLKFTPSRSAQGFLSIPLSSLISNNQISELIRLHVWLPDHQRGVSEVGIHSHQPFAQSWILAGKGTDRTFEVERVGEEDEAAGDDYDATHAEYALCWTGEEKRSAAGTGYKTHQVSSTVENTGRKLRVRTSGDCGERVHTRDMSYCVPGGVYHRSIVEGGEFHATLFFFDAERGFVADAGVAGPKDGSRFTQIRDAGGITAGELANLTNEMRRREQLRDGM